MRMEKAYTVREIDALRSVATNKFLWGHYGHPEGNCTSRTYREEEKVACVEQMVRTHMLAGHTAQDLLDSEVSEPTG
jgi:hypothetical protein